MTSSRSRRKNRKKTRSRGSRQKRYKRIKLLLCRHGEGQHLVGEEFSKSLGPSLTKEGSGQAYRRIARQLIEVYQHLGTPAVLLVSPQLRALQTCFYCRQNQRKLENGLTLRDIPCKVIPFAYEQTRCLVDQGNVMTPFFSENNKERLLTWAHEKIMKRDEGLWRAIRETFPLKEPPKDPGSARQRARRILNYVEKNYPNKLVLLISHDGISRDLIVEYNQLSRCSNIFDLCEIRPVDTCKPTEEEKRKKTKSDCWKKSRKSRSNRRRSR